MLKKIKENPKYEKLKELWKNEKTHSLIVLAFWLIFMLVLIIFVRLSSTQTTTTKTITNQTIADFENYEFSYTINETTYNGEYYDGKTLFYLENNRYYKNEDVYLIKGEEAIKQDNFDIGIMKINSKFINNLITNITPNTTDNYKRYIVPLDRFINLYDEDTDINLTETNHYNIIVDIYEKENQINKITLDLNSYFTLKNNPQIAQVTIYYYNINNINDFSKNYEKMIGVKQWPFN